MNLIFIQLANTRQRKKRNFNNKQIVKYYPGALVLNTQLKKHTSSFISTQLKKIKISKKKKKNNSLRNNNKIILTFVYIDDLFDFGGKK